MFALDELRHPIVQAPMAGGPSTPDLAVAVAQAGGLGFLAAGYKRAEAVREEIALVRGRTAGPFGVNIFVPSAGPADPAAVAAYAERIAAEASARGAELGEPRFDDDAWEAKLEVVCEERPAVVSFTFGCPDQQVVQRLHEAGVAVWVTVGRTAEAVAAVEAGADGLVVQGTEAGGHRGGFGDDEQAGGSGLIALLRLIARSAGGVPLIATGGIADGAAVAAVLCAGAAAAQIGTALMLAPEAGTAAAQRALLREPIPTGLTRAFSGRLARGMVNRFQASFTEGAPKAYPEVHHLTSPLRAAARRNGDADGFNLWAGQAHELASEEAAGVIVERMAEEARATIAAVSARFAP